MDNHDKDFSNNLHDIINNNLDKNNQNLSLQPLSSKKTETDIDKENGCLDKEIVVPPKIEKKKKKKKYKNLISEIMSGSKKDEQTEKKEHLELLKQSLGGGDFKKIDKI